MRRTEDIADILVVMGMLIRVSHQETNRTSSGSSFEDTRKDFDLIALGTRSGELALSWLTAIQFVLDKIHIDGDARRHTIYHASNALTMTFAKGSQRKYIAKGISHAVRIENE